MKIINHPFFWGYLDKKTKKRLPSPEGNLFFTFDDGPNPGSTTILLNILKEYNAKATFFCLGKNVKKYPELFQEIINEGHTIGNHSYSHCNGLTTPFEKYINDTEIASTIVKSNIFRPPYGKLTLKQYLFLRKKYHIILWDIMTYDFKTETTPTEIIERITRNALPGSIIVFHDTPACIGKLMNTLPTLLTKFKSQKIDLQ